MKLYYATGTCSLAPRIVAHELDIELDSEKVDIKKHVTETEADYLQINPKGYVPALELENGELLTEGVAIMQYMVNSVASQQLVPSQDDLQYFRLQGWLTFISTELHKMFSPWLFHPEYGSEAQRVATQKICERFSFINGHLEANAYLLGEMFTLADIYLYTISRWSDLFRISLSPYPKLKAYLNGLGDRSTFKLAMNSEGIV
ncbi:glutathione binding-like protein [Salinisphaera sp. SPP-AMP-43]|nr:glutathione binding-like protein [Salinisphaera hydrothermalis]